MPKSALGFGVILMTIKTLIIDKDKTFVKGLKYSLEEDDYTVEVAFNIRRAMEKIKNNHYDLIILDIVLHDGNGLSLCRKIRQKSQIPIVILTEKEDEISEILALDSGADDYIVKPTNISVFKARLKAILRRVNIDDRKASKQIIRIGDFVINALGRRLTVNGKSVTLTAKEFDLFYLLVSHPGRVFTREELLKSVWGFEYYGDIRTVDVHIRRLREKIEEDSSDAEFIHTKWGVGYYFKQKESSKTED